MAHTLHTLQGVTHTHCSVSFDTGYEAKNHVPDIEVREQQLVKRN